MISLAHLAGGRIFAGELAEGSSAYVDADWLDPVASGPVPALITTSRSVVRSWDEEAVLLEGKTPPAAVVEALLRVARAAAAAVGSSRHTSVVGTGFVARQTRELLGVDGAQEGSSVDVIVETRGDPGSLVESTSRVADLGTVVLAGVPAAHSFPFDLYPDVHVRGLRVVAVPLPFDLSDHVTGDSLRKRADEPTHVRLGEAIPAASWYRVTAR